MTNTISKAELLQRIADHAEATLAGAGHPVNITVTPTPDGARLDVPYLIEPHLAAKIAIATGAAVTVDNFPAANRSRLYLHW